MLAANAALLSAWLSCSPKYFMVYPSGTCISSCTSFHILLNAAMTLGEYREGDQVLPILLKDNTVDSFRINDLRTLPVFGTTQETTTLEQVVSEFDFQYKFSNVKDYNRQMVMMAQADPRRGVNAIAAFNRMTIGLR